MQGRRGTGLAVCRQVPRLVITAHKVQPNNRTARQAEHLPNRCSTRRLQLLPEHHATPTNRSAPPTSLHTFHAHTCTHGCTRMSPSRAGRSRTAACMHACMQARARHKQARRRPPAAWAAIRVQARRRWHCHPHAPSLPASHRLGLGLLDGLLRLCLLLLLHGGQVQALGERSDPTTQHTQDNTQREEQREVRRGATGRQAAPGSRPPAAKQGAARSPNQACYGGRVGQAGSREQRQ